MFYSRSIIRILAVLYLLFKYSAYAKETVTSLYTFTYEFDEYINLAPLTFIILSPGSIKQEPQVFKNFKVPRIETSQSFFDCSTLEKTLNLTSNSILLQSDHSHSSGIIYHECLVSSPNILGYFLVAEQDLINIAKDKTIQKVFSDFLIPSIKSEPKNKRKLSASFKDFNDLVFQLDGCVACAINDFQDLDILSFEDLSTLIELFLSYTQSMSKSGGFSNICDAITISSASVKLLKFQKFNQHLLMDCYDFTLFGYFSVDSIELNDDCIDQFGELLRLNLDYINGCITKLKLDCDSINDISCLSKRIEMIKGNYEMAFNLFYEKVFDVKHESFVDENGLQIKVNYTSSSVDGAKSNDLKKCGLEKNSFIGDLRILLLHHTVFGDVPARFILSHEEFECDQAEFDEIFEIVLYEKATPNMVIKNDIFLNFQYQLKESSILVNFKPMVYHYSYYFNLINCEVNDNICKSCFQGFNFSTDQCYQDEKNCIFYGPYLTCVECKKGYGLNPENHCLSCSQNCSSCSNYLTCLTCNDKHYLTANNTCFPCEDNCFKCTVNHCLNCNEGFSLNSMNLCIKCAMGCSKCDESNNCLKCVTGFYLSLYEGRYSCEPCGKNCEYCKNSESCDLCYAGFKPSYFGDKDCGYCPYEHCSYCDSSSGECREFGYGNYLSENVECVDCQVANCKSCFKGLGCLECSDGFYLVDNERCELCGDKFCKLCNTINHCVECKEGYGFNDASECEPCSNSCKICTEQNKCLTCSSGFYLFDSVCKSCNEIYAGCDECLEATVTKCFHCENTLMNPSDEGCKCVSGYFKGPLNNCLKCNEDCSVCTNYESCSICSAFNSAFLPSLGCKCNEGFYQAKEMRNSDACLPCEQNCKNCKTESSCLICEDDYFIAQGKCFQCGSLMPPSIVSALFLESFVDVTIEFRDSVFGLSCDKLFGNRNIDAKKFGKDFKCEAKSENEVFIRLGTGFTLINETIEIVNFYLEGPNDSCKIKIGFQYSAPLPYPIANILAPSKILANTEQLKIDGMLSSGGYKSPLKYEWIVTSETSKVKEYTKITDSSITIPKANIKEGVINVKLTVFNKFSLKNTIEKQIFCETNTLIVEFDSNSAYSCRASQLCKVFISKITPFDPKITYDYSWKISSSGDLLINDIELLNKPYATINPFSFKQGTIGFNVEVKNQAGVFGTGQVFVNIIYEKPVIMLDRTIGSISSQIDFKVDASQSYDPNFNREADENCLKFEWICNKGKTLCDFEYEKYNNHLFIPKNIVKSNQFDSFLLKVTSAYNLQSELIIYVEIIDTPYIPSVLNREYLTTKPPSRISLSKELKLEAIFLDNNFQESQYTIQWILNTENHKILSNKPTVQVNKNYLKPGFDYKLTFELIQNNATFNYYYSFIINKSPNNGDFSVTANGNALMDLFKFYALGFEDPEGDLPLLYSFGYYSDATRLNLTLKQSSTTLSTYLAYLGNPMYGFVQVCDSLGDCTEESQLISVKKIYSTSKMLKNMKSALKSTGINENTIPLILAIGAGILNEEFYETGKFSIESSDLQDAFDVCYKYLNEFVDQMETSETFIYQVSGTLAELTLNPNLKSPENAKSTLQIMSTLLDKVENGFEANQAKFLYKVLENSFTYSGDLISDYHDDLKALTTLCAKINKVVARNVKSGEVESIKSRNTHTKLYGLDTNNVEYSKFSFRDVSINFDSELTNFNTSHEFVLSVTFISLATSDTLAQNLLLIKTYDAYSDTELRLQFNRPIYINVPFDSKYHGQPKSCLYFDYTSLKWDDQGCKLNDYTRYSVTCNCSHLSTFTAGTFIINPVNESESNDDNYTSTDYNYFKSNKSVASYVCVPLFLIYLIFAGICFQRDRKDFKNSWNSRNRRARNNTNLPNNNVPVDHHENIESRNSLDIQNFNENEAEGINNVQERARLEPQQANNDSNRSDEISNIKTGSEALKEEFKALTIYFYTDPHNCKFYRCSLFFFKLMGIIFFISVFFYIPDLNPATELTALSIICTFFIIYSIQIMAKIIYKEIDLTSEDINRENFDNLFLRKMKKIIPAVCIYAISNIVFLIGAIFLVENMESNVVTYWIRAMGIGLGIELIIIPFFKIFFIAFIWSYLVDQYKKI